MATAKEKACRTCGDKFTPWRSTQVVCPNPQCALEDVRKRERKKRDREIKRETRERKEQLKSRQDLLKEAQAAFNRYIRIRDKHLPCISCGATEHQTDYHKISGWVASHYRSVGACPELRFNELNVHKACVRCNSHLSGNIIEYRISLIERIGQENVEWLESKHELPNLSKDDIRGIKKKYQDKARELEKKTEEHAARTAGVWEGE